MNDFRLYDHVSCRSCILIIKFNPETYELIYNPKEYMISFCIRGQGLQKARQSETLVSSLLKSLSNDAQQFCDVESYVFQVGGATAKIGDPSGKTKDREPMDQETVDRNIASIMESLERIFANHRKYFWRDQDKELPEVRYCQLQGIPNSCLSLCCWMEVLFYDLVWDHCMEYLFRIFVLDHCIKYLSGMFVCDHWFLKLLECKRDAGSFIMFIFFQFQNFEQQ